MLIIDDSMFKLARMQEALLKASNLNREENLSNYKKTVLQIDEKAYNDILEEIKHIDEHNQTLESELVFLEKIKQTYEQLLELQLSFKRVCDLYGDNDLHLSDLSLLNIDYIENRINAIKGYLLNIKNIETNKLKIQTLNEDLADEEKKKIFLDRKLLELEDSLRENFLNAEGRYASAGKLIPTSVVQEYQNSALDFSELMKDTRTLDKKMSDAEKEKAEVTEKLRTAEICYNSILTADSRQILEEIKKDEIKAKYRLTMLKILKLISINYENYDVVKKKREDLLDLIKYRMICIESLGVRVSFDPFSRTKVREQLETILALTDNTKRINEIRKQVGELNSRTEEMIKQNNGYLISLSDTRNLIENKISMNDIDITGIDTIISSLPKKEIADNQVTKIREIKSTLNMSIIGQKTDTVIRRVNQMIQPRISGKTLVQEAFTPELVIVPHNVDDTLQVAPVESHEEITSSEFVPYYLNDLEEQMEDDNSEDLVVEEVKSITTQTPSSIELFETTIPFSEPTLFESKIDDVPVSEPFEVLDFPLNEPEDKIEEIIDINETNEEEMPDAFWITQDTERADDLSEESPSLSFDDQIDILLSTESVDNGRIRKKVA